ncbi:MAG TPA: alkaline phosphatase family protein [Candidatus Eisenbacteria bacterium]|nr:alkaline phosphatase family protein [Candidatus Eisenbacteria bacterium]
MRRVLLFFIDGLGVGSDDPAVNVVASGDYPTLALTATRRPSSRSGLTPVLAHGVDASLGVPGLPQSATGQTSILTGVNAPAAMGRHVSGFPGPTLRAILAEHSILKRIREAGRSASFLNAYGTSFFQTEPSKRRLSATSLATIASGAPFRTLEDLLAKRGVVHDLTHWRMRERGYDVPLRTPEEAGAIIAEQAMAQDFSLFEYFETDRAGHDQDAERARRCLSDLDRALETVLARADLESLTVVVVSDHGNVEDGTVRTHTLNPAHFALWGSWTPQRVPERLTDIAALCYEALGLPGGAPGGPGGSTATSAA